MPSGLKNRYICKTCHDHIITVEKEDGVTPIQIHCKATKGCGGQMVTDGSLVPDGWRPHWEWRKPTELEYKVIPQWLRDHCDKGGLILNRIPSGEKIDLDTLVVLVRGTAPDEYKGDLLQILTVCTLAAIWGRESKKLSGIVKNHVENGGEGPDEALVSRVLHATAQLTNLTEKLFGE